MRRPFSVLILSACLVSPLVVSAADSLQKLSRQLARGVDAKGNRKVAVLAFPYHDGKVSSGSSIVSERLTTEMVSRKGVVVVERRLIQKLLEEKKLNEVGVIDPDTAKVIGSVLGVEAIITGTLIDLDDKRTEINARTIHAKSGEILSVGTALVERSWSDNPRVIRPSEVRKPLSVEKPVPARVPRDPMVSEDSEEPEPEETAPKVKGKGLRFSNDSLPPGRRYYQPPIRTAPTYRNTSFPGRTNSEAADDAYDDGYDAGYYRGRAETDQKSSGSSSKKTSYPEYKDPSFVDQNMENFRRQTNRHLSGSSGR